MTGNALAPHGLLMPCKWVLQYILKDACVTNLQQEFHPEFLIRVNLRYEKYPDAIEHALSLIRKVRILS